MENPFKEEQEMRRPTFLLVLCILTFIGSGWSVISNLFSIFTANFMNMSMSHYSNMMGEMEGNSSSAFMSNFLHSSMDVLQLTAAHAREIAVMQLVLSIISLIGAILMFQLRRSGFYFYVAAQILMLFIMPYFGGFSSLIVIGMIFSAFIALIFIIMYAVNLKYMTR